MRELLLVLAQLLAAVVQSFHEVADDHGLVHHCGGTKLYMGAGGVLH